MTQVNNYNLLQIAVPLIFGLVIIALSAYFIHKLGEVNSKTEEMVEIVSNQQKILIKHEDAITMIVDNINQRPSEDMSHEQEEMSEEEDEEFENPPRKKKVSFNLDEEIMDELDELNELDGNQSLEKIEELTESDADSDYNVNHEQSSHTEGDGDELEKENNELDDIEKEFDELDDIEKDIGDINEEIKDIKKSNDS